MRLLSAIVLALATLATANRSLLKNRILAKADLASTLTRGEGSVVDSISTAQIRSNTQGPLVAIVGYREERCHGPGTGLVLADSEPVFCHPIDPKFKTLFIEDLVDCEISIISTAWECEAGHPVLKKQGVCMDLTYMRQAWGSELKLWMKCKSPGYPKETVSHTKLIAPDASNFLVASTHDISQDSVTSSRQNAVDTAPDRRLTSTENVIITNVTTNETDSNKSPLLSGRGVVFMQYEGQVCWGVAVRTTVPVGNLGDPPVVGCIPISDASTRYKVLRANGCVTTLVSGDCTVPVNLNTWTPVGVCQNIEITGREDWMVYYKCAG